MHWRYRSTAPSLRNNINTQYEGNRSTNEKKTSFDSLNAKVRNEDIYRTNTVLGRYPACSHKHVLLDCGSLCHRNVVIYACEKKTLTYLSIWSPWYCFELHLTSNTDGKIILCVQVCVSLHLPSSPNEFSWGCKFVDCVSILSDL